MVRSRNAGFDRTNPWCKTTYICDNCGKRTRETGHSESGVGLCKACFIEAGEYNTHTDYHSKEEPDKDCQWCKEQGWIK